MPPMPGLPSRKKLAKLYRGFLAFTGGAVMHHHCDRCGHSKIDGQPVAHARYVIKTPLGDIYLCGHHFRKHREHIAERAYETYEVA